MNLRKGQIRVLLIGGTSHVGKSTLGKALASKLGWDCVATDSLGKHPGRPWISTKNQEIKEHVVRHYRTLTAEALLSDVLYHYQKNILPQIEAFIDYRAADNNLIIEGSALYPQFVDRLLKQQEISGIWLTASDRLLIERIQRESNFYDVDRSTQYLIEKFLARTLLYNQSLQKDILHLGLKSIQLEQDLRVEELEELIVKCFNFYKDDA